MPRPPYFNFPFPFYRTPPKYHDFQNSTTANTNKTISTIPVPVNSNNVQKDGPTLSNQAEFRKCEQKNKSNKNYDYLFDLFGLKIYSDDVLLVSLIYCLYSEGVKDDGLFIVLILLLLS